MLANQETQPIRSKIEPIPRTFLFPIYLYGKSDFEKIRGGVTVYLAEGLDLIENHVGLEVVEGAVYVYGDRLTINYPGTAAEALEEALSRQIFVSPTAEFIESHLRSVTQNPGLLLQHIKAGVQRNGHPFQQFGFVTS